MFKNLRTSTKLLLLCSVFVGALIVATYGLVAEKQIAIQFVRKELVGVQHLEALREVYALVMKQDLRATPSAGKTSAISGALNKLAATDSVDSEQLDTRTCASRSGRQARVGGGSKRETSLLCRSTYRSAQPRIADRR
jgi:hypothetical protein